MINRPLGIIESVWAISSEKNPVNAVTMMKVNGPLTQMLMQQVMQQLQQRHPILQTRLLKKGRKWYLRSGNVPAIPVVYHKVASYEAVDTLIRLEYDTPFNYETGPFFRLVMAQVEGEPNTTTLITNYLHVIGDGDAILNIMYEMMLLAQQLAGGTNDFTPTSLPVAPVCEYRFPKKYSTWRYKLKSWWFMLGQSQTEFRGHHRIFPERNVPLQQLATGTYEKITSAKIMKVVSKRAKQHSTNVHGAIAAAALLAQYDYYAKRVKDVAAIRLKCNTVVNMRPFLDPPLESHHYGSYVSMISSVHKVSDETDFWDLAYEIKKRVSEGIKKEEHFLLALFIKPITRLFSYFDPKEKAAALSLSNVGRIPIPTDFTPFTVTDVWGNVSNIGGGSDISLVVDSFAGTLYWSYTYTKPMAKHEDIVWLADRAVDLMEEAVK